MVDQESLTVPDILRYFNFFVDLKRGKSRLEMGGNRAFHIQKRREWPRSEITDRRRKAVEVDRPPKIRYSVFLDSSSNMPQYIYMLDKEYTYVYDLSTPTAKHRTIDQVSVFPCPPSAATLASIFLLAARIISSLLFCSKACLSALFALHPCDFF